MSRSIVATAVTVVLAAGGVARVTAQTAYVTGTIAYRERIALPPTAVVEVSLEDVSRADAAAQIVASARLESPGLPPIRFELPYDYTRIDAGHRYAVRARIVDAGRVLFTTTETTLVVTQGHGSRVELLVRQAPGAPAPDAAPPAASPGPARSPAVTLTNLPASFGGTLPCADCPGIRYQLNLFPDDSFFARMTYLERAGTEPQDDLGSWTLSSDRRAIVLKGKRGVEYFAIRDTRTLRKLDADGREIKSALPYDLHRTAAWQPIDVRAAIRGIYRTVGGSGEFTECSTGQRWPVATEGAMGDLDAAYRQARKQPGEALMIAVDGRVAPGEAARGGRPTLVVERVGKAEPGAACDPRFAAAPLENTYWRLVRLGAMPVPAPAGRGTRNEPSLTFSADPRTVSGSTGCNRLTGTYDIAGSAITFGAAGTMMACATTTELETAFKGALKAARSYRILGRSLELLDADGATLARFDARDSR